MSCDYSAEKKKIPKNAGKAPSFQLYAKDWLSAFELQSCSLAAQGLFINMLCLMSQSDKVGYLLINGNKPAKKALYKALSIHYKTFDKLSNELLNAGVLKQDEGGVYYCSRMVRDNALKKMRQEVGRLGGNPDLVNQKNNQEDNQEVKSYSSSSSFSISHSTANTIEVDCIDGDGLNKTKEHRISPTVAKKGIQLSQQAELEDIFFILKTSHGISSEDIASYRRQKRKYGYDLQRFQNALTALVDKCLSDEPPVNKARYFQRCLTNGSSYKGRSTTLEKIEMNADE